MQYIKYSLTAACVFSVFLMALLFRPEWENIGHASPQQSERMPIAVLGDSDSHSYRDSHIGTRRGGDYHAVTWQWTEILQQLRSHQVELGQFSHWGTRGIVYRLRDQLGLDARMPRKQDYEYNFAFSGATCDKLATDSNQKQAYLLGKLIDKNTAYWNNGLVIIRIGINNIGTWPMLQAYINDDASATQAIYNCIAHIDDAIRLIRQHHASVRIALVGIIDNSNWPIFEKVSDAEHKTINQYLDIFDKGLIDIATKDDNVTFVDDRSWYENSLGFWKNGSYIGDRHYPITDAFFATNTKGDHPQHIVLGDNHASTIANAMWLNNLISHINKQFGFTLSPISKDEISSLIAPHNTGTGNPHGTATTQNTE